MTKEEKHLRTLIYIDSMELTELLMEQERYGTSDYIEQHIKEVSEHMNLCSAKVKELREKK